MAIRALRLEIEAWRRNGAETEMELRHAGMARVTELGDTLMRQEMAILRAVRRVAGRASLDPRSIVLENEWSGFIGMTFGAPGLLEAAEQRPARRLVRVMAGNAFDRAFVKAVTLVEAELRKSLAVAVETDLRFRPDPPILKRILRHG